MQLDQQHVPARDRRARRQHRRRRGRSSMRIPAQAVVCCWPPAWRSARRPPRPRATGPVRPSHPRRPGYGSLTQNDLALRLRTDEIEVRFVPARPPGHPPAGAGQLGVAPLAGRSRAGRPIDSRGQRRRRLPPGTRAGHLLRPAGQCAVRPADAHRPGPEPGVPAARHRAVQRRGSPRSSSNVREQVSAIYPVRGRPAGERLVQYRLRWDRRRRTGSGSSPRWIASAPGCAQRARTVPRDTTADSTR